MKHKLAFIQFIFITCAISFYSSSHAEPTNLNVVKQELKKYHDSGLYEQELTRQISKAELYITQEVSLEKKKNPNQKLALILDIDETSLSNYDKMVKIDFSSDPRLIQKELLAQDSPVIKPMLMLYNKARQLGVDVFFITGRRENLRKMTANNLLKIGYKDWAGLYLKPINYTHSSNIPFKSNVRKKISESGYLIVASIGDQYSDFKGGYTLKGFKLPNPYYYLP